MIAEILRRIGAPSALLRRVRGRVRPRGQLRLPRRCRRLAGLFMEAGDEMFRQLERKYAAQPRRAHDPGAGQRAANIEQLFAQAECPAEPDIVSIDVDGQDYWIWEAIERYRPRVLVDRVQQRARSPAAAGAARRARPAGTAPTATAPRWVRLQSWASARDTGSCTPTCPASTHSSSRQTCRGRLSARREVAVRGTPNYYQRGHPSIPAATARARYLDLETGKLVSDRRP